MRGALIVGIGHYPFGKLNGSVNDANNMAAVLLKDEFGKRNFDIDLMVSEETTINITQKSLRRKLEKLFSTNSEVALFYFSGHGTENNLGGYIVPQDAEKYNEGISVHEILQFANDSDARDKIIILDSCHSGHMGNTPIIKNDVALLRKGVSILTSSNSKEKSFESGNGSIFTTLLIQALQGGAADVLGKVSIPSVYSYLDQGLSFFQQRPLFKSHVSSLVSIRDCRPAVEIDTLQKIVEYFPNDDLDFALNPSFEPTVKDHDPDNAKILSHLQKFRDARLLIPVGADHMYDACMNYKYCRLTQQGRYYWYLVKNNLI